MGNEQLSAESAKAKRRWDHEQALASSSIEGHVPTAAYLADSEAVIEGTMTLEEAMARSLTRALAADKAATERKMAGLQTKKAS